MGKARIPRGFRSVMACSDFDRDACYYFWKPGWNGPKVFRLSAMKPGSPAADVTGLYFRSC